MTAEPAGARLLLIRRDGTLWGVAHAAVHAVARPDEPGGGYRVRLGGEGGQELAADEVVGVAEGVAVRPAGGVLSLYWREPAGGLAVHGAIPLVVLDPERPPSFLRRTEETEVSHGDDGQAEE